MGLFPPWFFDTWTPKKLPGLQLWLRADRGVFQDSAFATRAAADADPVGGWQDQSGVGNHVTQGTAAKRPTLRLAVLQGHPALRWDGVDDVLSRASPTFAALDVASTWTGVVVANVTGGTDNDLLCCLTVAGSSPGWRGPWSKSARLDMQLRNTAGTGALQQGGATALDSTYRVLTASYGGTNTPAGVTLVVNGTVQALTNQANNLTGTLGTNPLQIGGPQNFLTGNITTVLLYTPALTTPNRVRLERWLGGQYGITVAG